MWKRNLPPNPTDADMNKARAYPPSKRDVMLKKYIQMILMLIALNF